MRTSARLVSVGLVLAAFGAARSNVVAGSLFATGQEPVTYTEHIAPIVLSHCAPCHRPGQAAPFSLLTYEDVRRRARLIQEWIAQGAVEGDPGNSPPPPEWPEGWQLGEPDLVVRMPEAYVLNASGPDELRNFVLPIPTDVQRFVRGIEFQPGNPAVVHHATLRIDRTQASRRFDDEDPQPGYRGILAPDARYPDGYFLAWTPGQLRPLAEEGFAWRLEPGSDLVLQLHLQPSGRQEGVAASVGLFFTDHPPASRPSIIRLSRQSLDIPPDQADYVVEDRYVLPVDVTIRELQAHAHLLARRFEGSIQFRDGSTRSILEIPDWDFKWQDVYRLREPLQVPAGASLVMRVTYDNTRGNARNPFNPPRRVRWGQDTVDEMGELWIQVLTKSREAQAILERDFGRKSLAEDVVGYEGMLARDPDNPGLHENLAAGYVQLGDSSQGLAHLRRSLQLNPSSAMGHYNLGTALLVLGRPADAIAPFEEAIRLKPDLSYAHNSLGYALKTQGRIGEAIEHYRRAVDIEPRYAHAHNNLGAALQAVGRLDEAAGFYERAAGLQPEDPIPRRNWARALILLGRPREGIAQFRLAVETVPDWPELLADFAWVLSVHADATVRAPREAARLAQRAAELTSGQDPRVLDVLSVAWAATGGFAAAADVARSAMSMAAERQDAPLAAAIGSRLRLYERNQAYVHDFVTGFGR